MSRNFILIVFILLLGLIISITGCSFLSDEKQPTLRVNTAKQQEIGQKTPLLTSIESFKTYFYESHRRDEQLDVKSIQGKNLNINGAADNWIIEYVDKNRSYFYQFSSSQSTIIQTNEKNGNGSINIEALQPLEIVFSSNKDVIKPIFIENTKKEPDIEIKNGKLTIFYGLASNQQLIQFNCYSGELIKID